MNNTVQGIKMRFGIIGRSELLNRALNTAIKVANTDLTVLISGESGVGKEVFSKILHSLSSRKHNSFIAVNCGAIPAGTINSELFGHVKGAFTGANSDRKGYFETVNEGTIFLDEIGELPLDTQSFLLRILESGEYIRVGSSKVQKTNVRVVAATNVDLIERIRKGKFREDLYYRLNIVPIKIPALRERKEDLYLLFRKFSIDFAEKYRMEPIRLDDEARILVENYRWPGNIRELKNFTEQLSILSEERIITSDTIESIYPELVIRNLPSIRNESQSNFEEREILYKLLFEMKNDVFDLKRLVFELISKNNLEFPEINSSKSVSDYNLKSFTKDVDSFPISDQELNFNNDIPKIIRTDDNKENVFLDPRRTEFQEHNIVEESLSLEEMEKELINKALIKHKGKRKDAAKDLGISERTLYRKLKQYELED